MITRRELLGGMGALVAVPFLPPVAIPNTREWSATARFTAPADGKYWVSGSVKVVDLDADDVASAVIRQAAGSNVVRIELRVNGRTIHWEGR